MNARGIPPVVQQVLAMLLCLPTRGRVHHPDLEGEYPYLVLNGGGGSTSSSTRGGLKPPSGPGMGYPCPDLGWGTPDIPPIGKTGYPPVEVSTDTQSENITFPHPLDAAVNIGCELYLNSPSKVKYNLYSET